MNHIHHGTCPECGRDHYIVMRRRDGSDALPAIAFYHLDEPCALTEAVPADTLPENIKVIV